MARSRKQIPPADSSPPSPTESTDPAASLLRSVLRQPDFHCRLAKLAPGIPSPLFLDHADEAAHGFLAALACLRLADSRPPRIWLLCASPRHRERLAMEMELWGIPALCLPEAPAATEDGGLADPESAGDWFATLESLARQPSFIVAAPPDVFSLPAPSPQSLRDTGSTVRIGDSLDPEKLASRLAELGYDRAPLVTARGQFALRGGILDLFTWQAAKPLRIELFDTEIESIREFDPDSQASTGRLQQAELLLQEPPAESTLAAYRNPTDLILAVGPDIAERADLHILAEAAPGDGEEDFSLAAHGSPFGHFDPGDFVLGEARREAFFKQILQWRKDDWEIAMVFSNDGERERFSELVGQNLERDLGIRPLTGELLAGFTLPAARLALLSSSELFGRYRMPASRRRSSLDRAHAARAATGSGEMEPGDLVVHYEYGIARFRGIEAGAEGEELVLEYREGALLGVPLDQAHLVGKYVGLGGGRPELSRLGGASWKTARKAAEKSIQDYAAQLLRVQAERRHEPGHAHPPDSRWMWEFERSFHFTETTDQRRAIEETKTDLEAPRPMDRLICGDVGFGKTEVAIRAAFKAVAGGKQVAILVPTTVLAEQHWRTFRERMSDYPFRIDLLNRFRSPAEVRETLAGLAEGTVDLVIGTHRLISGDVHFKNLGLVVVDEEQRFGVAHKEKFKVLFRQIDVLTLSATPIPRTLYMALMGARDMSTIETPPPNRVPVATSVCPYDERVIRDAIRREMKRGGQTFFLHNRVKSIEAMRRKIADLVPEARILVGHGQMDKDDLEQVMRAFVRGEADVLLATTIIETGIDIPNANTILIDRADRFGLADLYQLRGRVGRAGEKAYAILMLPRDMITAGDARKRIHAIKEYTALGSGFKIAMRDLEIRGAGNLLGTRQSGHIAQIGFDLYCQLLRQSVHRLQGQPDGPRATATFKADFLISSETRWQPSPDKTAEAQSLPAFLPTAWLADTGLRIQAYRELAEALSEAAVNTLERSWQDRHGRLPAPARHLLLLARIKAIASAAGIASVEIQNQRLMIHRNGDFVLLEGRRFPRLTATRPLEKLHETTKLLRHFA
jgi:transcription-repair coupling factor (superfamily II helicase)